MPDRDKPTWEGDVALNPYVLRLLECCDGRSVALFKQVVRESALEIDWRVRIHQVLAAFPSPLLIRLISYC